MNQKRASIIIRWNDCINCCFWYFPLQESYSFITFRFICFGCKYVKRFFLIMKTFQGFAYGRRPVASIVVVTLIAPIKSLDDSTFILFCLFFTWLCWSITLHSRFICLDGFWHFKSRFFHITTNSRLTNNNNYKQINNKTP